MRIEMRSVLSWSGIGGVSLVAALGASACSEQGEDPGGLLGNEPGKGGGNTGNGGAGVTPGAAGAFSAGGMNISIGPTPGSSGNAGATSGGGFETCAGTVSKADLTPVN